MVASYLGFSTLICQVLALKTPPPSGSSSASSTSIPAARHVPAGAPAAPTRTLQTIPPHLTPDAAHRTAMAAAHSRSCAAPPECRTPSETKDRENAAP